jgi:hypothetical protein
MNFLINAIATLATITALVTFIAGCGTDTMDNVPTTLEADSKTGEVSLKGERGEKGDPGVAGPKGDAGPAGKDGAPGAEGKAVTGAAGKDGTDGKDAVVDTTWTDPVTGKRWFLVGVKYQWSELSYACSPWKVPTSAELRTAVNHGLAKQLKTVAAADPDKAWSSEENPNAPTTEGTAVNLYSSGHQGILKSTSNYVYCYEK